MNFLQHKWLYQLDWLVAGGCIAWGLLRLAQGHQDLDTWFWVGGGVLGLVLAWVRPAEHFARLLQRRMIRKSA